MFNSLYTIYVLKFENATSFFKYFSIELYKIKNGEKVNI